MGQARGREHRWRSSANRTGAAMALSSSPSSTGSAPMYVLDGRDRRLRRGRIDTASGWEAAAQSMILVFGPRVAVSGLRRADCRAGGALLPFPSPRP